MSETLTRVITDRCVVPEDTRLRELTIEPGAEIEAPEGKYVVLVVDGVQLPLRPGTYTGDVLLAVRNQFTHSSFRFGEETVSSFRAGAVVKDGKILRESSVPEVVQGGTLTDSGAEDIRIESRDWDFNGFYLTGDTEYAIRRADIHLVGDGTDDFVGLGAAIAAAGRSRVTVEDTKVRTEGVSRSTLFVGEDSDVTLNNCDFATRSEKPTPEEMAAGKAAGRMMEPPWSIGIRGNGRALNLAGNGHLTLNRCHVTSNSWGVLSIDGARVNRLDVNDSLIEITGDNGYGCFCICDDLTFDYDSFGEPGCIDTISGSTFNVAYTGVLMSLGNGCAEFRDGAVVNSRRFGAFVHRHNGGWLRINSGAEFHTAKSCIVVKGSNLNIQLDNAVLDPGNGTILQLMDNDDVGMGDDPFQVPVGEVDVRDDRDLTVGIADEDVFVQISNLTAKGDFLNSTTDIKACNRKKPRPRGGRGPRPSPVKTYPLRGFMGDALMGAKNMVLDVRNADLTGRISAATAKYRDGVTVINYDNFNELSEITQTPAQPINNGVILSLDGSSRWELTGTCYLTSLTLAEGAVLAGPDGKTVRMTVDGAETPIAPGKYTGLIELSLA